MIPLSVFMHRLINVIILHHPYIALLRTTTTIVPDRPRSHAIAFDLHWS
jgi:hypothetical protein